MLKRHFHKKSKAPDAKCLYANAKRVEELGVWAINFSMFSNLLTQPDDWLKSLGRLGCARQLEDNFSRSPEAWYLAFGIGFVGSGG